MAIESTGHSPGNPRIYELVEHVPKSGDSPTVWAWPQLMDWFKVAGQPVPGPWPPHQQPRPDPEEEALPVAITEPEPASEAASRTEPAPGAEPPRGGEPWYHSESSLRPRHQ